MIVIATPTGQIGRQVLEAVSADGTAVRVIARDPSRLPAPIRDRVEVVEGSTADAGVVTKACVGAESVFWLAPPDPQASSLPRHIVNFTLPLCEAIASQNVQRVVAVSSLGRSVAKNAGQISAVFAMDSLIESTGVSYRSLQAPGFMENLLWQTAPLKEQGVFYAPGSAEHKTPSVATRDIAAVAADLLLDESWRGQENVPLLGPEDLSYNDMARIMAEVLARPIRFQQIPAEAYKASLTEHGMSEAWAQGLVDMAAAVDAGIYDAEPRSTRALTPTSFQQWCEEILKPAVSG